MIADLWSVAWLFLPAGVANMAPVIVKKWPLFDALDKPIDAGRSFRDQRILGDNKTWRGFVAGWLFALILVGIQYWLYKERVGVSDWALLDYSEINILVFSFLMAFGALGGDAVKSFFKRRAGIKPGESWVPFDQLDWVIGAMLTSLLVVQLPIRFYVLGLLASLVFHPLINLMGWLLKLKDKPF